MCGLCSGNAAQICKQTQLAATCVCEGQLVLDQCCCYCYWVTPAAAGSDSLVIAARCFSRSICISCCVCRPLRLRCRQVLC